jgi:DNA polymerase III subunit epsilon
MAELRRALARLSVPGPSVNPVTRWDLTIRRLAGLFRRGRAERAAPAGSCGHLAAGPPWLLPPQGKVAASALATTDFVIVDVETTGWLPEQAMITEIGAVRFSGGRVTKEFSALVNPGMPIPADITTLTGITDAMVGQAPQMAAVMPAFLAFADGCVLAAHNAPFDIGFLTAACTSCGIPWPAFAVVDTAVLARLVLAADVPDCKLATLATYFGARTAPCHRALADAKATADVLQGLLDMLAAAGARTLADIRA